MDTAEFNRLLPTSIPDTPIPLDTDDATVQKIAAQVRKSLINESIDVHLSDDRLALEQKISTASTILADLQSQIAAAEELHRKWLPMVTQMQENNIAMSRIADEQRLIKTSKELLSNEKELMLNSFRTATQHIQDELLPQFTTEFTTRMTELMALQVQSFTQAINTEASAVRTSLENEKAAINEYVLVDVNNALIQHLDSFSASFTEEGERLWEEFKRTELRPRIQRVIDQTPLTSLRTQLETARDQRQLQLQQAIDTATGTASAEAMQHEIRSLGSAMKDKLHDEYNSSSTSMKNKTDASLDDIRRASEATLQCLRDMQSTATTDKDLFKKELQHCKDLLISELHQTGDLIKDNITRSYDTTTDNLGAASQRIQQDLVAAESNLQKRIIPNAIHDALDPLETTLKHIRTEVGQHKDDLDNHKQQVQNIHIKLAQMNPVVPVETATTSSHDTSTSPDGDNTDTSPEIK